MLEYQEDVSRWIVVRRQRGRIQCLLRRASSQKNQKLPEASMLRTLCFASSQFNSAPAFLTRGAQSNTRLDIPSQETKLTLAPKSINNTYLAPTSL